MPDDEEKERWEFCHKMAKRCRPIALFDDIPDRKKRDKFVLKMARRHFTELGEQPRCVLFRATLPSPKLFLMATLLDEETAPYADMLLRVMAKGFQAKQVYQLTEMWMAPDEGTRAMHHPERKEAVMIIREDATALPPICTWFADITRDEKGKPSLGEWYEMVGAAGRLTYVLPPEFYGKKHEA